MRGFHLAWVAGAIALAVGAYVFARRAHALPFEGRPAPTERQKASAKDVAAAVDGFAFRLAHQIAKERKGKSFLISPLSVSTAHSMLLAGMVGDPKAELAGVLGYRALSDETIAGGMHALNYDAQRASNGQFRAANGFMLLEKLPLETAFTHTLTDYYDAEFRSLPGATPESVEVINAWVKAKTDGMIPKIVDGLGPQTSLVLLNASTFDADWVNPFNHKGTRIEPFTTGDGKAVDAPLMNEEEVTALASREPDELSAAELPYKGDAFGMVVLLPPEGQSVWKFLEGLDGPKWAHVLASLKAERIDVTLPKFTFDDSYDLVPVLGALGAKKLFKVPGALLGVSRQMPDDIVVQDLHKTHVDVDEKGTRAGAATEMDARKADVPTLRADRAFVYAIVHRPTGLIVFLGVCSDPTQAR